MIDFDPRVKPGDDGKKTLPGRTIKQSIANFLTKKTGCFQPVFLFFTNQLFIL